MGLITDIATFLFGSGRNVVAETAEVFRVNADASDARGAQMRAAAMQQFSTEFSSPRAGLFDRLINGLNRLPRPLMAFGTIGLMVSAMTNPVWFAERMVGIALVPEPLWWLMGAIVSFYFGARYQVQGQRFQRSIAETMARVPQVSADLDMLAGMPRAPGAPQVADTGSDARETGTVTAPADNAALAEWMRTRT
ncbi:holin family protein [Ponticoccus sp. SC2-23]|uniref:holin family protein n=1 Tax=Alexandriicola marinus TaxID=2081710 RepID=UPI00193B060A|nr:holin family protein [Alexandriicola marinus]MBM1219250.1 holin family protein [Ponticoccus sp. SC6-9]MBM1223678.1 holin family protein [Ponticoccus sp. SC6-15]MBM1229063.1 holin family protein [Ponticoccus sp. SC6-38]MBM1232644.1 holin family protein [Ponticoccus sp. SC6-45]MBM1237406.1 holin family protein [Ponticoccus sp. SC6-49]MBM1241655.1 holin family protein [Ponticoccus sp. SC2-64]MBM1246168.1 holin family protein [Ponticoccus sp. SC6-42]MBM1250646.1 holin family protein [Pontico